MRRLGILGGTFDPIHYGHLFIAEEARMRLNLDQVLFIPNGDPPHKENGDLSPAHHRLHMTCLAIDSNLSFFASSIEIEREGPSYAADTLRAIRREYSDPDLRFIMGMDNIAELPTWHLPLEILALCRIAAVSRPGFDAASVLRSLPDGYRERIDVLEAPGINISATEIRNRVRQRLPIRYLTPDPVVEYITQTGLYRADQAA